MLDECCSETRIRFNFFSLVLVHGALMNDGFQWMNNSIQFDMRSIVGLINVVARVNNILAGNGDGIASKNSNMCMYMDYGILYALSTIMHIQWRR